MKTQIQKRAAFESPGKTANQKSVKSVLQAYKNATAQLIESGEEEIQLKAVNGNAIVQRVPESEGWKLERAYQAAVAAKDENVYYQSLNQLGYPNENDESDEPFDPPVQLKSSAPVQFARSPNSISGPKSYGSLKNILYKTDALGNIDFANPKQYTLSNPYLGINPVNALAPVDVTTAVTAHGKGNRYQHFKEANAKAGLAHFGGSSPTGWTWHHLTTKHQMHLVDRLVHSKHGHNGGVYLW